MRNRNLKKSRKKELGATLVEYGVVVASIAIVTMIAVRATGNATKCSFVKTNAGYTNTAITDPDCTAANPH